VAATKSRYKKRMGHFPDLKDPKTLTEKMQYLKLHDYWKNPVVGQCADKYAVREYVAQKGCQEILNELYAVYSSVEEIDWEGLPNKFVLKCNHGCGWNIICRDKSKLDIEDAKKKLRKWMKESYGLTSVEYNYEGIERKIICEKLIETEDGRPPWDYKIFCSYGEPKLLYIVSDREKGHTKSDFFTPDGEWIDARSGYPNVGPTLKRPGRLGDIFNYARRLSEDFPLVRVDFYYESDQIIFGELTFMHAGGTVQFDPPEIDKTFGDLFPIKAGN